MNNVTIDKKNGLIRPVRCVENDPLTDINIKGKGFLLLILTDGEASFISNGEEFSCRAPSFVCFDELDDPKLISSAGMRNYAIRFHPTFLNVNMTFDRIRSDTYEKMAYEYDLFYCRPFIAHKRTIPIPAIYLDRIVSSCCEMKSLLENQWDVYWSCRGRSCFIEIMVILERLYNSPKVDTPSVSDMITESAKKFIESNYAKDFDYSALAENVGCNKTTLREAFKRKYGITAFAYLKSFRIDIAKRQIEFTNMPIKDISNRCGYKNVQHFTRVFKKETGETPAAFRKRTLKRRREEFGGM